MLYTYFIDGEILKIARLAFKAATTISKLEHVKSNKNESITLGTKLKCN